MKKLTKKIYAILLTILLLLNYIPMIVRAVDYSATFILQSEANKYNNGDEISIDLKVEELVNTGAIKQFAATIEYDETALTLTDIIVSEPGYSNESNVSAKRIVLTKTSDGTIDIGDIVGTLKFTALKSSDTPTTVRVVEIDATCNTGDVYFDDGNVNNPEITLPVEKLTIEHNLKITKTDNESTTIQNNSALFKITNLMGEAIYVETEADGTVTIPNLEMPTTEGPFVYTIKEILAPTGYVVNENDTTITVTFNEDGSIATIVPTNGIASIVADTNTIDVKISNEAEVIKPEQEVFNLVLNKVDEENNSITTDTTDFTVTMPDGTSANYTTNIGTGKTENIVLVAPEAAGTYAYIIKETKAPEGYITEPNNIIVELTFEEQENKIVLVRGNIINYGNETITPVTQGTTKTLTVNMKNESEIITYNYTINIDKVKNDTFKTNIIEDSAIFEITKDDKTSYVKTNALGKASFEFSMTNKEIVVGQVYTYTIKEIKAPEGYVLDENQKTISLTFNNNGSINEVNVEGENIVKSLATTDTVNLQIINEEKPVEEVLVPENFNLVINKVDELGNLITTDSANFVLTKPDGTRQTYTTTNGVISGIQLSAPNNVEKQVYFLKETKAPEGYNILEESLVLEMNYTQSNGKIVLENVTIKEYENQVVNPVINGDTKTLTINVKNDKIETYNIQISAVDRNNQQITSGTTVVKLTNTDTNEYFYKEVEIVNGKIELNIPTTEGTVNYELEQIKAPEGYENNSNKISISMNFEKNVDREMELIDYTVEGIDVQKGTSTEENTVNVIITNDEIKVEPEKQNYSLEINKLDSETSELIQEGSAIFTLVDSKGKTKDYATNMGKTIIDGLIAGEAGEETIYVIKEKTAPDGYKPYQSNIVIKVAFEEINSKIVVVSAQILIGEEVATVEMEGTKVKISITNEKENEELYVISKKQNDGIDIYNLFESYTGSHYTIESPFIDTKIARLGNNSTVQEFINNLESNGILTVWDEIGNQIPNGNRVKTKMILKATKGEQEKTFTIVIKGDSDGDGRVRTKDLNMLIRHLSAEEEITSSFELRALDLVTEYGDGIIRTTDLNMYYTVLSE